MNEGVQPPFIDTRILCGFKFSEFVIVNKNYPTRLPRDSSPPDSRSPIQETTSEKESAYRLYARSDLGRDPGACRER
jgi:hypothetical protein